MKHFFIAALLLFLCVTCFSQKRSVLFDVVSSYEKAGITFKQHMLFEPENASVQKDISSIVKDAIILTLNTKASMAAFSDGSPAVSLTLPYSGNREFVLILTEQKINNNDDFSFGEITGNGIVKRNPVPEGLHYRGILQGDSNSLACISIFSNGDIMGLFSNAEGNFVLGKMNGSDKYILYNDKHIQQPKTKCATEDLAFFGDQVKEMKTSAALPQSIPSTLCKKVRLYWEIDYGMYRYRFGSNLSAVQNYVTGLFNQFAAMYQNEGITVELSASYVWTTMDPYRTNSSSNALNDFRTRWNLLNDDYNADIAHLVSSPQGYNNGGIAYRGGLCFPGYGYGYSNIYTYYENIPVYSWDVEVTVHEVGHNFGSRHTQWCGWNTGENGSCGAIDDCYTPESFDACNTCPATVQIATRPPGWQGTVMSYCHLANGVGINLANGFGPLPQAVIRNFIDNSGCTSTQSVWTGVANTSWFDIVNWNCGSIPGSSTEVVINAGASNYPEIAGTAICKSLRLNNGSSLRVNTGFSLLMTGSASTSAPQLQTPYTNSLYITGSATAAGWMNWGDTVPAFQKFNRVTNVIYEINSIWLTGGGEFLFVPLYGDWNDKYGFPGTRLTNATGGDALVQGGADLKAPAVSGFYRVIVNFQTGSYIISTADNPRITVPPSSALFITGSATPAGWMANGAAPLVSQQFTRISNTLYEISSIQLNAGGSYVFVPVYGDWSAKYGGIGDNNTNAVISDFFQGRGSDLLAPATTGNYKVTVDFQRAVYTLTRLP